VKLFTDYALAVTDYARAELESLKRGVVKTVAGLGVMLCAGVFVVVAIELLFLALFLYVADGRNWTLAALVTGGLVLVFSVVVAQVGLWLTK
jgi:hypothetical protein